MFGLGKDRKKDDEPAVRYEAGAEPVAVKAEVEPEVEDEQEDSEEKELESGNGYQVEFEGQAIRILDFDADDAYYDLDDHVAAGFVVLFYNPEYDQVVLKKPGIQ